MKIKPRFYSVDCEMVVTDREDSSLARISITEYNKVIIDKLVIPNGKVNNYLTHITGITRETYKNREELFDQRGSKRICKNIIYHDSWCYMGRT
eukprot:UN02773